MLLVGDSAAMVVHGHDNTLPITLDEMLTHCKAAARGAQAPFLVGDLPFGTYETGAQPAVSAAVRMLKEGGMDAVKLEGALCCTLCTRWSMLRRAPLEKSAPLRSARHITAVLATAAHTSSACRLRRHRTLELRQ